MEAANSFVFKWQYVWNFKFPLKSFVKENSNMCLKFLWRNKLELDDKLTNIVQVSFVFNKIKTKLVSINAWSKGLFWNNITFVKRSSISSFDDVLNKWIWLRVVSNLGWKWVCFKYMSYQISSMFYIGYI
jgi:hypothetical protein